MAKLGSPQTNQFNIGTAEVRVGPLSSANKLTQAHSIGLVDDANVEIAQTSVELLGGFPQLQIDSAVISQESSMTATIREFSKRNLDIMMGEGIASYATDVNTLMVTDVAAAGVSFDVTAGDGGDYAAGDIISFYKEGAPEEVTVARVDAVAGDTVTLDAGTPSLYAYAGTTDVIKVFKAQPTAVGAITETNYFSTTLVQTDRARGRPIVLSFWKGSISSGLTYGTTATDFGSTELGIKFLQPTATDITGDLSHISNLMTAHPVGMRVAGGDL